ncbi:hypothetical protein [Streptomyces sp. NPDC002825]|uniref:hypothetical protein n=1 Tax=Streptomyces sp. NPDC002825 TaxID=3154666 RepID=UPI00331F9995
MPDELRDSVPGEALRAALSAEPGTVSGDATPGEAAALAAFRVARDEGLHTSLPTRDRDDWTPRPARRRPPRSLKAVLASLVASVTLGGVAVATGGLPEGFPGAPAPRPEPRPARSAPGPGAPAPSRAGTPDARTSAFRSAAPGTTAPLRPEKDPVDLPGKSRDALCRAVERTEGGAEGKAAESAARQRLAAAAGGEELVPAYCRQDPRPTPDPTLGHRPTKESDREDPAADPGRVPDRSRAQADRP